MEEVIDLATRLGEAISKHPRFKELRKAEEQVLADEGTKALIENFNKAKERIFILEKEGKPIEPAEKKRVKELEEDFKASSKLSLLIKAQADYSEMINKVNEKIFGVMGISQKKE